MTTRDIGAGWKVVEVVDTRGPLAVREEETPRKCDAAEDDASWRCDCCDRKIQIIVLIQRGDEHKIVGESCARKARLGRLPARVYGRRPVALPIAAAPVTPPADVAPVVVVDESSYTLPDGSVDLMALLGAIDAAERAA